MRTLIHTRKPGNVSIVIILLLAALGILFATRLFTADSVFPIVMTGVFLCLIILLSWIMERRRLAHAHSLEAQQLFSRTLEADTLFTLIANKQGVLRYVSRDTYSHLRFGETPPKTLIDVLNHMALTPKAYESLLYGLKTGQAAEAFFLQDDEQSRWHLVLLPIDDSDGCVVLKVYPTYSEEHMGAPKRLSAERYIHMLAEQLPAPVFITNQEHQLVYVNPAFESVTGYHYADIQHEPLTLDTLIQQHSKGRNIQGNYMFRASDGKWIRAYIAESPMQHTEDEGLSIGFLFKRQSQRVTPSQANPEEEQVNNAWSELMEHSPIATAFLDIDGHVMECNLAFLTLIGNPPAEELGWSLHALVPEEEHLRISSLLAEAEQQDMTPRPIEVRLKEQDASNTLLYISKLRQEEDSDHHFIAHLSDISEQKNLEAQFAHSQKMQAVGQLAGGVAHDFNNLLTAMIGFCDLLLTRHPPGDPSFADIMQIKQNANRAANLVRQLLAFSRKQTLQPKVLDITEALSDLSNLIRRLIGENITLSMQHGRDLWLTKVDQGQLEQAIINLAVNARDAMDGKGTLAIETRNVTVTPSTMPGPNMIPPSNEDVVQPGEYVRIDISDTGCGMSREILSQVFEPFFTTKGLGEGTGLGLATVYGIINQTGGYIYAESHLDKGTTFTLFLKRYETDANTQGNEQDLEQEQPAKDLSGDATILLVEDEDPVRMFSKRALENKGYHVLEAASGEQALEVIANEDAHIKLIISDVMMPGMTGPDMVKKILETHSDIEIIFISGYGEDAFGSTFGKERNFYFLPKPFTLKQLAGKVKEVLEGEDSKQDAA